MKKKTLKLWNYTYKDSKGRYNPCYCGIYHKNGKKIATNAHLLCAINESYPKELEGKLLQHNNIIIDTEYVNWESVVPLTTQDNILQVDLDLLKKRTQEGVDRAKVEREDAYICINITEQKTYYESKELKKFLDFIEAYPDCKIYYTSSCKPLKAENGNKDLCLIMPRTIPLNSYDIIVNYLQNKVVATKKDGIATGAYVKVPSTAPAFPYTGRVLRCYELGPVSQERYAVIIRLDRELMETDTVRRVYPSGLMLCMDGQVTVVSESDDTFYDTGEKHFIEDCLYRGWTLYECKVCTTGQMLYFFETDNGKKNASVVVREDGHWERLYERNHHVYTKRVVELLNGY